MAADVVVDADPPNPCCSELRKKYAKLEERRNALRQAVNLLEKETGKLLAEKDRFKKAYEEEQLRVNLEKEAKERESTIRSKLEKEVSKLMSEISSQPERNPVGIIEELESSILEKETEIRRLKELVVKEEKRADCEKKRADAESKRAAEAWKLLKLEKSKAEDERRIAEAERNKAEQAKMVAETERKKAEDARLCLANFQKEESGVRENLIADVTKKLEAEKQKSSRERKRADSEKSKAEEQRKLVEVERRKTMDEKARGDHLVQQLEEEKQRREVLENKMEEYMSFRRGSGLCSCLEDNRRLIGEASKESAKEKLLKERLKLEKKRVKYAQKVAQLEKHEKSFVCQQLHILKQDLIQFSFRLGSLDGHLSGGIEGRNMPKTGKFPELSRFMLQNKFLGQKHDINSREDPKILSDPTDPQNLSGSRREFAELDLSGGSCHLPMPGTSSELESPLGGPIRKISQSSAVCSTSTSFSDKKFIGSQGKDAFPITNMVNLAENSSKPISTALKFSGKVTKIPPSQNIGDVGENFGGRYVQSNPMLSNGGAIIPGKVSHGRKKRRVVDKLDSLTWLHCEDNQLNHKIGEKLSTLEDIVKNKGSAPGLICPSIRGYYNQLEVGRHPLVGENDGLKRNSKPARKSVEDKLLRRGSKPCAQSQSQKQLNKIRDRSNTPAHTRENIHSPVNSVGNNKSALVGFDSMVHSVDFMKLLDLDDGEEERKYREAVEMPLSPSLPEIGFPRPLVCGDDNFCSLVEGLSSDAGIRFRRSSAELGTNDAVILNTSSFSKPNSYYMELNENGRNESGCLGDNSMINIPPITNGTKTSINVQSASCGGNQIEGISQESDGTVIARNVVHEALDSEKSKLIDGGRSFPTVGKASQAIISQSSECATTAVGPGVPLFNCEVSYTVDGGPGFGTVGNVCVIIPDNRSKDDVSRIVRSMYSIIGLHCRISRKDGIVAQVVNSLAYEADLLSEEKVWIFFSSLLNFVSNRCSSISKSILDADLLRSSEAFAEEMKRAVSDETTRRLLLDACPLDNLVGLIRDFLIDGKVLACDGAEKPLNSQLGYLDGKNISMTCRDATFDQLLAGSIILASICAAFDHINILLEISYKILRQWRKDTHRVLFVLHIFASICGMNFLVVDDCFLLTTAIRLVVSLLERQYESGFASLACPHPAYAVEANFPRCEHCPFSANAVCVDKFTSMLLDMLRDYASNGNIYPGAHKSSEYTTPTYAEVIQRSTCHGSELSALKVGCDTYCPLLLSKRLGGDCTGSLAERAFCCFTDILSLVELVACYMSWEWTYKQVLSRLLKILDVCVHQEFSAALFLLIGQLGRLGIDAGGYQQTGITEVKCHLNLLLGTSTFGSRSLFTQLAAIGSLLNFVPLKFQEIIDGSVVLSTETNHIILIKKWFTQLSTEEKSLSLDLLSHGDVHKT